MVEVTEFTFTNKRGQILHAVQYLPEARPRAYMFWHHGIGEHIGRYDYVFRKFADAGVAAFGYDAHGHGKSEPKAAHERALIWKFDNMVDDYFVFHDVVEKRLGGVVTPAFACGHSLGALVVTHAVLRQQHLWVGLVLHSASIDVVWTPVLRFQAMIGNLLAACVPRARIVPAVKPEDMHPDPAMVKAYVEDPLNIVGNIRARTGNEILHGFRHVNGKERQITLPIYAAHGTNDHTTSSAAVKKFLGQVGSKDVTWYEWPGGYHELLVGYEKEEAAARILEWCNRTLNAAAPKL